MDSIKHLKHKDIDKKQWDDFIKQSPQGIVYAFSFYLDAITPNWEAIVFEKNNNWTIVFPVPIRQKYGFKYISQPYLCQQLGFFSKTKHIDSQTIATTLSYLSKHFSYCNRLFINVLASNAELNPKTFQTHLLVLNRPYDELFKGFKKDRKQNLVRAKNSNWQIEESKDFETLILLHQQHNELKAVGRTLPFSRYLPYIDGVNELIKRNLATVFYASQAGIIEAGCLFVFAEKRIIYLFNGASPKGRSQHGRLLIINEVIKKYSNTNFIFDFEDPNDAKSVSDYYASFGSEPMPFTSLTWSKLPIILEKLLALRRWLMG